MNYLTSFPVLASLAWPQLAFLCSWICTSFALCCRPLLLGLRGEKTKHLHHLSSAIPLPVPYLFRAYRSCSSSSKSIFSVIFWTSCFSRNVQTADLTTAGCKESSLSAKAFLPTSNPASLHLIVSCPTCSRTKKERFSGRNDEIAISASAARCRSPRKSASATRAHGN